MSLLEVIFKSVITIIFLIIIGYFLVWFWTSHVDVQKTFCNFIEKIWKSTFGKKDDFIITRNEECIYRNGECIGNILGIVKIESNKIYFEEINNGKNLKLNEIVEYKRRKIKIIKFKSFSGQLNETIYSEKGIESTIKYNVYTEVECEIIY